MHEGEEDQKSKAESRTKKVKSKKEEESLLRDTKESDDRILVLSHLAV